MKKILKKWVSLKLPKRPENANKGTFGKVLTIAGSKNYPGAAYLTCAAAYRVGVGLVTLATESEVKMIVSKKLSEVTFLSRSDVLDKLNKYDVLLIGPGLGQDKQTIELIKKLIKKDLPPAVIDADGLNILAKTEKWWEKLDREAVLTPHPGEMSRLTGLTIKEIQSDRVNIAQLFAKKWNKIIVLKGAKTVIVSPAGQILISSFANPILATAGTGDILSGIIAGLLAQGLKYFDAACIGVYIHGLAGEEIGKKLGNAGMLAGDLLSLIPLILRKLR